MAVFILSKTFIGTAVVHSSLILYTHSTLIILTTYEEYINFRSCEQNLSLVINFISYFRNSKLD